MSIDKITARILEEAKQEAKALCSGAELDVAALTTAAEAEAAKITADSQAQAANDAAVLIERRKSVAELEARKMRLAAKQEMIEESFAAALKELTALPEADYMDLLVGELKEFSSGKVILNPQDKKNIGARLAEKLAGTGLTVAEETADIAGGFLLQDGSVSVNGSLESMLDAVKKQITAQIAQTLFS